MIARDKQVPEEVLPAEDNGQQAMADAKTDTERLKNATTFACLLCGDKLKCTEADSLVYMVSFPNLSL